MPHLDFVYSSLWRPKDAVHYASSLSIPSRSTPGLYELDVGLFAGDRSHFDTINSAGDQQAHAGLLRIATLKINSAPLSAPHPRAVFGHAIALDEARLSAGQASPGGTIQVVLRWVAVAPPGRDFTYFVQVLDPNGKLVAQQDSQPSKGRFPTSAWDVGDFAVERVDLTLPATAAVGRYRVITGWYQPLTGQRLSVDPAQQDDAFAIGNIDVPAR